MILLTYARLNSYTIVLTCTDYSSCPMTLINYRDKSPPPPPPTPGKKSQQQERKKRKKQAEQAI